HDRFGVVAHFGNRSLNLGLRFLETLTPVTRELLRGDIDAISGSFRGRSCQHDRRSFLSYRTSVELSFCSPKLTKERGRPRWVVAHSPRQTRVRQMTQEN